MAREHFGSLTLAVAGTVKQAVLMHARLRLRSHARKVTASIFPCDVWQSWAQNCVEFKIAGTVNCSAEHGHCGVALLFLQSADTFAAKEKAATEYMSTFATQAECM